MDVEAIIAWAVFIPQFPGGTQLHRAQQLPQALMHRLCLDDHRHLLLHSPLQPESQTFNSNQLCRKEMKHHKGQNEAVKKSS
ncbi:hypothetical protein HPP92_023480 [Vanilla planifolia]|uniref:Uncharacterized protein n=1 Tax=Vanilla planifolia TaxID=51239 RepID=A0A835UBP5_VANPL|nr:hypothetical protein HPP92_023480 [Vanilla planifolia]